LGEIGGPFAESCIQPVPEILLLFHECFVDTVASKVDNCSLVIETLGDLVDKRSPLSLDSCDSGGDTSIVVSVGGFELEVI
jgi:hypothetical protein